MTELNSAPPTNTAGAVNDGRRPGPPAAPTERGVHARLAALPLGQGSASEFISSATMPVRVEFSRQLRRRRTQLIAALLALLPIVMALAFKVGGSADTQGGPALVDLATAGAGNFALFTEFASVGFLLVVLVAMFCGDTIASEASWSSLRYLLALPVPRPRLLRQKLVVALSFSFGVNIALPGWAYLVGGIFFGWNPARSPFGGAFTLAQTVERMGVVAAYACGQSLVVAGLAFLLGVLTDAPLAAVGGAVFLVVVSNIIDAITSLDPYRVLLPTHFQYSWLDALTPGITWDDMIRGSAVALIYSAIFFTFAWLRFARKDITS
jgi:ABC-2 type transport system permease protein